MISNEEILRRKKFLELSAEDERRLGALQPVLQRHAAEIIDRFYGCLLSHDFTRRLLEAPGMLDKLKKLQTEYFARLTSGTYDLDYCENRLKVGFAHERVGLEPQWYLGAYSCYHHIVSDVLHREFADDASACRDAETALTKIIFLDMGLAIDAYIAKAHERLEESNRNLKLLDQTKRQLTEMIVHDLQNPLAGIEGFLQYLRSGKRLEGAEVDALEEALARCGDLENMIQNVLQIRKMEEGKLELYVEEVDLREFVPRCARAFEIVARNDGKEIAISLPESPMCVRTDSTLLQRILYNLIRNAVKHTRRGTSVRVDLKPPGEILVEDRGPGIPADLQAAVFERFGTSRLREAGMRTDTGLGLPFCRMAADALGAGLKLESEPGRGSTFHLNLATGGPAH